MTFVTDPITYNVNTRGRKVLGQDRNFELSALARLINGPAVQETVKHGDMLGYFGHWPRIKFGMATQEGGIDKETGKAVNLPLAVRTVELSADDQGNITHRTEFMDTEAGAVALGLYNSKAGGFSSAIVPVAGTHPIIPKSFNGFDYVYQPNYTTNRGHKVILDSINPELAGMLDVLLDQAAQAEGEMAMLFDSLHTQHLTTLQAFEVISKENDWLIRRLSKQSGVDPAGILDSMNEVIEDGGRLRASMGLPDYDRFKTAPLELLDSVKTPVEPESSESRFMQNRFGKAI